jgi:hypothetical protein
MGSDKRRRFIGCDLPDGLLRSSYILIDECRADPVVVIAIISQQRPQRCAVFPILPPQPDMAQTR